MIGVALWAAILTVIEVRAGVPVFRAHAIGRPVAHAGSAAPAVRLLQLGALGPAELTFREPDRLVAYAGLHADWRHLLQVGVLVSLAYFLAVRLGVGGALLVMVGCAVTGGAVGALAESRAVMVGSSAAVYGVIAAWSTVGILDRPAFPRARMMHGIVLLLAGAGAALEALLPRVALQAHVAGAITGVALGAALRRFGPGSSWLRRVGAVAMTGALLAQGVALTRAFREGEAGALDRLAGVAAATDDLDAAHSSAIALVEHPDSRPRHLRAARLALARVFEGGSTPADELATLAWREGRVADALGFERLVFEHVGSRGHGRRLVAYGLALRGVDSRPPDPVEPAAGGSSGTRGTEGEGALRDGRAVRGRGGPRARQEAGPVAGRGWIELLPADPAAGRPRRILVHPGGPLPCGLVGYAAVRQRGGQLLGIIQVVLAPGPPPRLEWPAPPSELAEDAELVPLLVDRRPFWLPHLARDDESGPRLWPAGPRVPPPPPPVEGAIPVEPPLPGPREAELDPPAGALVTACAPEALRQAAPADSG